MLIGGLDIGTTGCKLTVCSQNGEFVYNSYKEYDVQRVNGEHEIDANITFPAVLECIKDTTKKV